MSSILRMVWMSSSSPNLLGLKSFSIKKDGRRQETTSALWTIITLSHPASLSFSFFFRRVIFSVLHSVYMLFMFVLFRFLSLKWKITTKKQIKRQRKRKTQAMKTQTEKTKSSGPFCPDECTVQRVSLVINFCLKKNCPL